MLHPLAKLIDTHGPKLEDQQIEQLIQYGDLLLDWNTKINLVSRKDTDNLWAKHLYPPLLTKHVFDFSRKQSVLDIGTGGGIPGIPLAILYPQTQFVLVDSILKKAKAVNEITEGLALPNVTVLRARAEQLGQQFDFITGRAVTRISAFHQLAQPLLKKPFYKYGEGGIFYFSGGDQREELKPLKGKKHVFQLDQYVDIPETEGKILVYLA